LFFIMSFYEFRAFYILVWICFFYFIWYVLIEDHVSIKNISKNSQFALMPILICLFLNLYWIIALAKLNVVSNNSLFSRGLFGNSYMNILESIALFHPYWTGGKYYPFIVQPIPPYFFIIPLFAFLGLWVKKNNKDVIFFGLLSLLGILLSKQVAPPFENLYLWLYSYFPGFNAFREASKFYFVVALGYSVLIGAFSAWIWELKANSPKLIYLKYCFSVIIITVLLINTKPIITGEIGTLFVPRTIPNDYIILKNFVLGQNTFFRTLWIPTDSRWGIYNNLHPKISLVNAINMDWISFQTAKIPTDSEEDRIIRLLNQPFSQKLLNDSSIKYLIVPLQDKENDDDFYVYYGHRNYYIDKLNEIPYLKKRDIGTKEVVVYEINEYRPHIYVSLLKEIVNTETQFKKINFSSINQEEFSVNIKNISSPFYLNFTEAYHPNWKIHLGTFHWLNGLTNTNYYLREDRHSASYSKLNIFYIDPKKDCKLYSCKINSDGSFNIDMTIFFTPQSYMYIGFIISFFTLVVCLISAAVLKYKQVSQK